MLFRASQVSFLGLVIIWLASLTGLSCSAHSHPNHHSHTHHRRVSPGELNNYKGTDFNLQAHIYEKMFMWEAYQIFVYVIFAVLVIFRVTYRLSWLTLQHFHTAKFRPPKDKSSYFLSETEEDPQEQVTDIWTQTAERRTSL